ncbi:MAG: GIY-YIG nuclease family protein [Gammaproteobacteria bacterium]
MVTHTQMSDDAPEHPVQQSFIAELRRRLAPLLVDASPAGPPAHSDGFAIYTLADPRQVVAPRYVGQSRRPSRRFIQHVMAAHSARQSSLSPVEVPWWYAPLELQPLHHWIRDLSRDGGRLPCMMVHDWVATEADARQAERRLIADCLQSGHSLFNVEARRLRVKGVGDSGDLFAADHHVAVRR